MKYLVILILLITSCAAQPDPPVETASPSPSATSKASSTASATPLPSATATATAPPTPSASPSPTPTATATPLPTYVVLRGEVIIDQAVCHYGPGAPYLYKYGVYKGSNLEILRRVALGNYIEIQAIGGSNACWVREDYLAIKGSLLDLQPVDAAEVSPAAFTLLCAPHRRVCRRAGNQVTVSWHGLALRAGDDFEQTPYIVETWVCRGGQMVFDPVGTYRNAVEVSDEPGCAEPSRARLLAAEKHGYTRPVEIDWPPAAAP